MGGVVRPIFPDDPTKELGKLQQPRGIPVFPGQSMDPVDTRLDHSQRLSKEATPDSAARVMKLGLKTGLPRDFIARNLDEVEAQSNRIDFNPSEYRKNNPEVAAWLAEHPDHASLAKDDLSQLGVIEGSIRAIRRGLSIGEAEGERGLWGMEMMRQRGQLDHRQQLRFDEIEREISAEPTGRDFFQDVLFQGYKIIGQFLGAGPSVLSGAMRGGVAGGTVGLMAGPAAPVTVPAATALGATVGAVSGMWNHAFLQEGGNAYIEAGKIAGRNGETLDEGTRRNMAIGVGILNATLETAGGAAIAAPALLIKKKLAQMVSRDILVRPTMRAALADFGKSYAIAIGGETGTEVLQEMTSVAAEELAKMSSNGQFETLVNSADLREATIQRLADIAKQTATGMLLVGFPGASTSMATSVLEARKAQQRADYYTALGEEVTKSKTFERLPEALQDVVKRMTKDGPIERVYVDVEPFVEYWQSKGEDPKEAARVLWGNTEEFDRAQQTGEPMALDMATYATRVAPTEHNAFFAQELRRSPAEMNAKEGKELEKQLVEEAAKATEEEDAGREKLVTTISEQLEATKRYDKESSKSLAQQMAAFFTTMGKRTGKDPVELFNQYGITITGEEPQKTGLLDKVKSLFQRKEKLDKIAVRVGEDIFKADSHFDALQRAVEAGHGNAAEIGVDGYVTNKGRFITRKQGIALAFENPEAHPIQNVTEKKVTSPAGTEYTLRTLQNGYTAIQTVNGRVLDVYDTLEEAELALQTNVLFQSSRPSFFPRQFIPGFYSKAESLIQAKMGGRMKPSDVKKMFQNNGVKADEMEWAVGPVLDNLEDVPIERETLLQLLSANRLMIVEGEPRNSEIDEHAYNEAVAEVQTELQNDYLHRHFNEFVKVRPDGSFEVLYWNYMSDRTSGTGKVLLKGPELTSELRDMASDLLFEEMLEDLHLQDWIDRKAVDSVDEADFDMDGGENYEQYTLPGGKNYKQLVFMLPGHGGPTERGFNEGHYQEENVFAHVRFKERVDAEGRRVLFIEEIQSDWHQQGRDRGYAEILSAEEQLEYDELRAENNKLTNYDDVGPATGGLQGERLARMKELSKRAIGVPDAPFKKTWHEFVIKRMVQYAVDNGFDAIGLTTGEQQNVRYGLEKHVSALYYYPPTVNVEGDSVSGTLNANMVDGRKQQWIGNVDNDQQLASFVGKEVAEKLLAQKPERINTELVPTARPKWTIVHTLSGLDLKVGGQGMRSFYDKTYVDFLNKIGKKHGAKVVEGNIYYGDHGVDVEIDIIPIEPNDLSMGYMASDVGRNGQAIAEGKTPEEAEANASAMHEFVITPALAEAVRSSGFELFQPAWHGSPYVFDEFSLHKIGTGEGAQSYGWGLYFTGRKEIAEEYRRRLSNDREIRLKGKRVNPMTLPYGDLRLFLMQVWHTGNVDSAISSLKYESEDVHLNELLRAEAKKVHDFGVSIKDQITVSSKNKGRVYKVDIPEDDTMLLWDKPMAEQPRVVREVLEKLMGEKDRDAMSDGSHAYAYLVDLGAEETAKLPLQEDLNLPDEEWASRALAKLGVTGIKYADQGSRFIMQERQGMWYAKSPLIELGPFETKEQAQSTADRQTTYNYVVFDDKLIKIIEFEQGNKGPYDKAKMLEEWQKLSDGFDAYRKETEELRAGNIPEDEEDVIYLDLPESQEEIEDDRRQMVSERLQLDKLKKYIEKGNRSAAIELFERFSGPLQDAVLGYHEVLSSYLQVDDSDLFQGEKDTPRGKIMFGKSEINIQILENADFSTFLHESGHLYLEVFKDLMKSNKDLIPDYAAILDFLGAKPDKPFTVEQHEKFAQALEAYFREGRAPSVALRQAFRRFRAWLMHLYATLMGLNNVRLTDNVRDVMDRMFASEEEINSAEQEAAITPLFLTAEQAKMTEAEFATYTKNVQEAHIASVEKLQLRLMKETQREQQTEWRNARAAIADEVNSELDAQPPYRALAALQRGEFILPNGERTEVKIKLDRADVVRIKGEPFLKALPLPHVYAKEGGVRVAQAAELFGFGSADELLEALASTVRREEQVRRQVDERMKAKFGDMRLDGTLADAAEEAALSQERESVILAELRALRKQQRTAEPQVRQVRDAAKAVAREEKAERDYERRWLEAEAKLRIAIAEGAKQGEIDVIRQTIAENKAAALAGRKMFRASIPTLKDVRAIAERRIANTRIRDLRPDSFWVAARKAGRAAAKALAEQNFVAAANFKQQELLNVALYRAATQAKTKADRHQAYARRLLAGPAQRRIGKAGHDYLDQINKLLERFDFARLSLEEIDKRATLVQFIASQEAKGMPVNIPEEIQSEAYKKPWKEMTVSELDGLRDVLKHIENLAKLKLELLTGRRRMAFEQATASIVSTIVENSKGVRPTEIETRLPANEAARRVAAYLASHRKFASMMRQMGGFDLVGGPLFDFFVNPINQAANRETTMVHQATLDLHALFEQFYSKEEMAGMFEKTASPLGVAVTKMARLMMALNWGAEDNRTKLLSGLSISLGREVSESEVEATMDSLNENDNNFVQAIHDYIDTYWPQMSALAKRIDGVVPERVEATARVTRFGEYRGGYFPLVYDDRQSGVAESNIVNKRASDARHGSAVIRSTKAGARHERVKGVKQPVRLDFGVIFEHISDVVHDITHTEMLIDVQRLLQDDDVEAAIRQHYGDEWYRQLKHSVRDIATGDLPAQNAFDRSLNWVRSGTSIAGLGWNTITAALQPLGFAQSVVRIGPKWVGRGLSRWLRDAASMENTAKFIYARSEFMKSRSRTQLREINEIRNHVGLATTKTAVYVDLGLSKATLGRIDLQDLQDSFFWFITRMQMTVDIPTWLGEYEKQMVLNNGDEVKSVALADQAVIDSQSSGHIKDLAAVQRGNPALKLWTNFYSFFSATWNLYAESMAKTNFKSPASVGRLAVDSLMLSIIPAAMGLVIRNILRGDDDPEDWALERFVREQLSYMTGMLIGFRELSSIIQGYAGYDGPAGSRIFSETGKFIQQVTQGEADQALWRSLNNSAGILLHYPSAQVQRSVEGLAAYLQGNAPPTALIFGPPPRN